MNPISNTDTINVIIAPFQIKAKELGCNITIVNGKPTQSYESFYDYAADPASYRRPDTPPASLRKRNCSTVSIELTDEQSGHLVGCVASEIYQSELEHQRMSEIEFLAIDPKQQGKGLGTLLMNCYFDLAKSINIKKVTLEPRDSAEDFYTKKLNMRRVMLPNTDIQMVMTLP